MKLITNICVVIQAWNMGTSAQQSLSGPKGQVHALAISNEEGLLFAGTQVCLVSHGLQCFHGLL